MVGCRFIDIDADSVARIDRILSGGREPEGDAQIDVSALRDLASGENDGSGWRGIFKRG